LGPNGAGKTTTIEIIEGITAPTSGEIRYQGRPRDGSFAERCGIQFQATALQDFLTVREVLTLFASFYREPLPVTELIRWCDLGEFSEREAKDRKSTRLNSSHVKISYAVFCLKKKKKDK